MKFVYRGGSGHYQGGSGRYRGVLLLETLKKEVGSLKKRRSPTEIKALIRHLCTRQPLKLGEIAAVLERAPKHVRDTYLTSMIKNEELEYIFPETPAHPLQAYRTKKSPDG